MLPTFIVVGAMKAGTTALYRYLDAHPQVFMAEPKEIDFFVETGTWRQGRAWYEGHFAAAGEAAGRGECSPNYTKVHINPGVAERMAAMVPDARIVYLVRHPIERMRSMYLHQVAEGRERRPLPEALADNRDYLRTSMYGMQMAAYRDWFPDDQLLVVKSEDLLNDCAATLRTVYTHIGVDPDFAPPDTAVDLNGTRERRQPGVVGGVLQRFPPYARMLARSGRARARHRRLLTRPVAPEITELPPVQVAQFLDVIRGDLLRLRKQLGGDFDAWGLCD